MPYCVHGVTKQKPGKIEGENDQLKRQPTGGHQIETSQISEGSRQPETRQNSAKLITFGIRRHRKSGRSAIYSNFHCCTNLSELAFLV